MIERPWISGPYAWRKVDDWGRWVLTTDYGEERNLADGRAWDEGIELLEIEVSYTEVSGSQADDLFNKMKAAPALYEALREAMTDLVIAADNMDHAARTEPRWEGCGGKLRARVEICRAALAAAEGKQ